MNFRRAALLAMSLGVPVGLGAQQDPIARGFDFERRGEWTAAAALYHQVLQEAPGDVGAMLGLERVATAQRRVADVLPALRRALRAAPQAVVLFGVGIRAWTVLGDADSARGLVRRWAAVEPASEAPYQEWGLAAMQVRDRDTAREAYRMGREALGRPDALAGERAQLATLDGDLPLAVSEWVTAVTSVPGYRASAVAVLGQVPADRRATVLAELSRRNHWAARRIASGLRVRWGDPIGSVRELEHPPAPEPDGTQAMLDLLDDLRAQAGRAARLAQGMLLEGLASRVDGSQGSRFLLESAQAYADGGDQAGARRMLGRLATAPDASPSIAASAAVTLVGVLIGEGAMAEATERFAAVRQRLNEEDRQHLQRRLAEGWIAAGRLDQAAVLVGADSTVEGLALRGRLRLYRGDLAGAREDLQAAGPFAGARDAATQRAALLALLQTIPQDTLPALGRALFLIARGDSGAAVRDLLAVGRGLAAHQGGAELLLLAGTVEGRRSGGASETAEQVLRGVAGSEVPAAAAQAELELAVLYRRLDRPADAMAALEHLLLTWSTSAVAPEARRLLAQVKGTIPG